MKEFVFQKHRKVRLFVNEDVCKHPQPYSTIRPSTSIHEFANKSLAIEVALLGNTCNYARLGAIYEFDKEMTDLVTEIYTNTQETFRGMSMAQPHDIVSEGIPDEFVSKITERSLHFFECNKFIPKGKLTFYGLSAKIGSCSYLYSVLTDLLMEFVFNDLDINDDNVLNSRFIRCFSKPML